MSEFDEGAQYQEPVFDMSISTLGRINYEIWQANNAKRSDDIIAWYKSLKNLYLEALNEIRTEKDMKAHEEMLTQTEEMFKQFISYQNNWALNSQAHPNIPFSPPREIFDALFKWEGMLRKTLKHLLMKQGDRSDRAML